MLEEAAMKTHVIERHATTDADAETVFALLTDGLSWPTWSPLGTAEIERTSPDGPGAVGERRLFVTRGMRSHEEVVVSDRPNHFAYILRKGLPLKDYRADITMTPAASGSGTDITWRSTFGAKIPFTGWMVRWQLGNFIGDVVDGLAARASTTVSG